MTNKGELPKRNAPSSDAGCYEDHLHGHAKNSFDRAGSCGTAGIGTGNPSCSHTGNTNIPQDGRLGGDGEGRGTKEKKKKKGKRKSNK